MTGGLVNNQWNLLKLVIQATSQKSWIWSQAKNGCACVKERIQDFLFRIFCVARMICRADVAEFLKVNTYFSNFPWFIMIITIGKAHVQITVWLKGLKRSPLLLVDYSSVTYSSHLTVSNTGAVPDWSCIIIHIYIMMLYTAKDNKTSFIKELYSSVFCKIIPH